MIVAFLIVGAGIGLVYYGSVPDETPVTTPDDLPFQTFTLLQSANQPTLLERERLNFTRLAWSPTGDRVAIAGETALLLYDDALKLQSGWLLGQASPLALVFNADGSWLAMGTAEGFVRVWDVQARRELGSVNVGHPIRALAIDNHRILVRTDAGTLAFDITPQGLTVNEDSVNMGVFTSQSVTIDDVIAAVQHPHDERLAVIIAPDTIALWQPDAYGYRSLASHTPTLIPARPNVRLLPGAWVQDACTVGNRTSCN